jgi:hypothetical protein
MSSGPELKYIPCPGLFSSRPFLNGKGGAAETDKHDKKRQQSQITAPKHHELLHKAPLSKDMSRPVARFSNSSGAYSLWFWLLRKKARQSVKIINLTRPLLSLPL